MLEVTGQPSQSQGNGCKVASATDVEESQELIALDPAVEPVFDPGPHFSKWLQALEHLETHDSAELCRGVYVQRDDSDFAEAIGLNDQLAKPVCCDGTLILTEMGKLQADVEVNVAVIDGLFKGKITATEQVVLENHALVIGEINTPALTIRGGAIIEGRCYFEARDRAERWERPGWQALKVSFAKVWRGRIF